MCILETEELTVVSEEDLKPFKLKEFKVTKTGRTTGSTKGYIKDRTFSTKRIFDCYSISKEKSDDFSKKGDSGSGVFLVEKDKTQKPLGILIGGLTQSKLKIVCKIDKVLEKLGLKIVKFAKKSKHEKYWACMFGVVIICIICITSATLYMVFCKECSSPALSAKNHSEL